MDPLDDLFSEAAAKTGEYIKITYLFFVHIHFYNSG